MNKENMNRTKELNSCNERVEKDKLQAKDINNISNKIMSENSLYLEKEMTRLRRYLEH